MSAPRNYAPCPSCGTLVTQLSPVCTACGKEQVGRTKHGDVDAVDFLVPRNVNGWSLLSCYMGLVGLFLPLLGFFFAAPALLFGVLAITRKRKQASYGSVTSDIRAVLGLIMGGLGTVIWGVAWIWVLSR